MVKAYSPDYFEIVLTLLTEIIAICMGISKIKFGKANFEKTFLRIIVLQGS